ncbi:PepSY domain-containing protein [Aeoliella sp. SH292]|uniref:PepSY domain-containing protein n=1 Tax=Aeoliella sp. SH292 TaxID=3454464 RepID=UPI003F98B3A7
MLKYLLITAIAASPLLALADERPPSDGKPLAEIVAQMENAGYSPIVEVSFDDGYWEVEATKDGQPMEAMVDAKTGEVVSEHRDEHEKTPPADSLALSEVIASLAKADYADIDEVSFEGTSWEVEAWHNGVKRELRVDPLTAEVISDRSDD